ncbi:hypothetical protein ACIQCN_08930 [Pseudarthrobacter sp. NPDC092424]|uniref:hypothetical protein n=1 Tax=Pseudarthrobacter sp. NPDC092424 TaxID=3364415 RepID=UPI003814147A
MSAVTVATVWWPPAVLVPLAALALGIAIRYPQPAALALLLVGPLLTSTFQVGALTVDNIAVLAGFGMVVLLAIARRELPFTKWSLLPLVLAAAIFVTGGINGSPNFEACLRFISLATVPWVVSRFPGQRGPNDQLFMIVLSLGAGSVLAQPIIGYPLPFKDVENTGLRFGGLFGHPNFAAYSLSLAILYVASMKLNVWRAVFLLCAAGALMMTGSITAILILAACLGLALAHSFRRLILAALAAAFFLALAGQTLLNRLDFAAETALGAASGANSGAWRLGQWGRALRLLDGHEEAGIGWGQIPLRIGNGLGAHNAYVQLVVELGWAGALAAGLAVVATVLMAGRRNRTVLLGWSYVLLTSMSDPVLFYPSSMTVLLFILAAIGGPQKDRPGLSGTHPLKHRGLVAKSAGPRV